MLFFFINWFLELVSIACALYTKLIKKMAWFSMVGQRRGVVEQQSPPAPKPKRRKKYAKQGVLPPDPFVMLPTSKVELTISCKDLISTNKSLIRQCDPFCVVSSGGPYQWSEKRKIDCTETIENTHNPQWMKKIIVDYYFELEQMISFEIRDKNSKQDEFLGKFEILLSKLIANCGRQTIGTLVGKVDKVCHSDCGHIMIVTEEVSSCKQAIEVQFKVENCPRPTWPRSNDIFLVISRSNEDASYSVVMSTERIRSKKCSVWEPIEIRTTTLCNGDFDKSIKFDCFIYKSNGKHELVGTCYASLHSMITMHKNGESRHLVNEEKQKSNPQHASSGALKLENLRVIEEITFLDYIRNGTQMHFAVAIDFTASNGVHTDPKSLHFLNEEQMNSYEIALRGIGGIIEQYDSSRQFPAFGKNLTTFLPSHQLI